MTINVRKTTIVVSESIASEWLRSTDAEALKNQNVDLSHVVVYEDGLAPDDIAALVAAAKETP